MFCGFLWPWPPALPGVFCSRVWSRQKENQHLWVKSFGPKLRKTAQKALPRVKEFSYQTILSTREKIRDWQMHRQSCTSPEVLELVCRLSVVVKKKLSSLLIGCFFSHNRKDHRWRKPATLWTCLDLSNP